MKRKSGKKPNYQKTHDAILQMLQEEGYRIGDALPTVRDLVVKLDMPQMSVQQAVRLLAEEGIIERLPRKGCYLKALPARAFSKYSSDDEPEIYDSTFFNEVQVQAKKLRIGILSEMPLYGNLWKELFLDYVKEHPEIRIELVSIDSPQQYAEQKDIDILQFPAVNLPGMVTSDQIFDISAIGGLKLNRKAYYPSLLGTAEIKGRLWGLPLICGASCFFYNRKFEKAADALRKNRGFWDFYRIAEELSGRASLKNPLIIGPPTLGSILNYTGNDAFQSFKDMMFYHEKKCLEYLRRFTPFLKNGKIFCQAEINFAGDSYVESVLKGKVMMTMGNSSWYNVLQKTDVPIGIVALPVENHGFVGGGIFMNAVSNYTSYPYECLELLNYLAKTDVQKLLTSNGRTVCNREAIKHLKVKGLDKTSLEQLEKSIANTEIKEFEDCYNGELENTIYLPELREFQLGRCSLETFWKQYRLKAYYYFRSKLLLNGKNPAESLPPVHTLN